MDPLTIAAASGLRSRMESLDMLANNIANGSTGGYKADREFYSLYVAPEAADPAASTLPVIERPWVDFAQGELRATNNPLDFALAGKGFFAVNGPTGPMYTRDGSFRISPKGLLVTAEGHPVRAVGGGSVSLSLTGPVSVSADGSITQDGQAAGRLELVSFSDPSSLVKQGRNYFQPSDPGSVAQPASEVTLQQGKLEGSNVSAAEGAVRLVSVMRQFEMLQKAVNLGEQMNRQALEEVAKV